MLVTIFTATYNRAYIIGKLYESLKSQNCIDFEWVVVDDGSTDDTHGLMQQFINEDIIRVNYIKTKNQGKHRAINLGVSMAIGELFFIVDSDDYLTDDAVELLRCNWNKVKTNPIIGGICMRRINYNTNVKIGGNTAIANCDTTSLEIIYHLGIDGDKAEIFRTSVMQEFPFPDIEKEKFVPEALVWNRISNKYKLRFVDLGIYMSDYLQDGLSYNFSRNLKNNPKGFALFYNELLKYKNVPIIVKLKACIRLTQCFFFKLRR